MSSRINVKNKVGITKLASIIKQAGFDDVKVTIKSRSIILTPSTAVDLTAGLTDLKAGRYTSFKSAGSSIKFLSERTKKSAKRSLSRKR